MKYRFKLIGLALIFLIATINSSCSKDDENNDKFNYPIELLYGTWDCTHILGDNGWQEVSNMFSATFYDDGSYYGRGVLGDGAGTYEAKGNTITTYIDGRVFYSYDVIDFNGTTAELKMYYGTTQAEIENSTRVIRVRKRIELSGTKWAFIMNANAAYHRSEVLIFTDRIKGKYIVSFTLANGSEVTDDEGNPVSPEVSMEEYEYNFTYSFDGMEGSVVYTDSDGISQSRQIELKEDTLWLCVYGSPLNGWIPMLQF